MPAERAARKRKNGKTEKRLLLITPALGAALGLASSVVATGPLACVFNDTCFIATEPGTDWCRNMTGAQKWPEGEPENAVPVVDGGGSPPQGCLCHDYLGDQVLADQAPQCTYEQFTDDLANVARAECVALAVGFESNCTWTSASEGIDPPGFEPETSIGEGACSGKCINEGSCSEAELLAGCPTEADAATGGLEPCAGDTTYGDPGSDSADTTSGIDAGSYVYCTGYDCDIDDKLVDRIRGNSLLLATEDARLSYDTRSGRFVFDDVEIGSLAHELGFRSGDILETVDGKTIDGDKAAYAAAIDLWNATELSVRVKRGTSWITFTFTEV